MLRRGLRNFTIFHDVFGFFSKTGTAYIFGQYAPTRPLPEHSALVLQDGAKTLQMTALPNGVRIVTESQGLPSTVHLGVTLNAGTRDETDKYSSIVHSLAQTYLKTNVRTNEQINYGMIQMSGGAFGMNYSQDFMNYAGHCLAHDTYDIVQMLSDCVLDEKTIMDEEAAQWRIDEYWKFREVRLTTWDRLDEIWLSVAYGLKGYGMPLAGFESNFQNIGHYYMNQWRKYHVTPDRMIVWGAGVKSHHEFVDTVSPYFATLDGVKGKARESSKYLGGDHRELVDSPLTHISLSLQGPHQTCKQLSAAYVLRHALGSSDSGAGARVNSSLTQKVSGIEKVQTCHFAFSDTGNFRVKLSVQNNKVKDACEALSKEIIDSGNLSDAELARAKRNAINQIWRKNSCTSTRMQNLTQNLAYSGQLTGLEDLVKGVEAVTKEDVKTLVEGLRKSKPTVVTIGGNVHDVPTADGFHSKLK
jgi:predicted Zn-dependent peptidase